MEDNEMRDSPQIVDGNESSVLLLQLQDAFVSALTATGALGKMRAQLRATALALIRGDDDLSRAAIGSTMKPLALSRTAQMALLLLHDFLEHHHLQQTAGVFEVESGLHLLLSEQATLLGDVSRLPGEDSLLERLLHSVEMKDLSQTPAVTSHATAARRESQAAASFSAVEAGASLSLSGSLHNDEDGSEHTDEEDAEVLRELEKYEESIPFSDTEGCIDASLGCDEVEDVADV